MSLLLGIAIGLLFILQDIYHSHRYSKLKEAADRAWGDGKDCGERMAAIMFQKAHQDINLEQIKNRDDDNYFTMRNKPIHPQGVELGIPMRINRYDRPIAEFEKNKGSVNKTEGVL